MQLTNTDLEKGLKNKHFKKVERQVLINEYELVLLRKHQIERLAGFFDKKDNIFDKEKIVTGTCSKCKEVMRQDEFMEHKCKEDKEKIKQIVGDVV